MVTALGPTPLGCGPEANAPTPTQTGAFGQGRFRHVGICKKDLRGNGCGTLEILIFEGTSKMKSLQAFA